MTYENTSSVVAPYCLPLASLLHVELMEYICPHSGRGCGSEGNYGHTWEFLPQLAQLLVVWPEVVSPLADAVSFINHKPDAGAVSSSEYSHQPTH